MALFCYYGRIGIGGRSLILIALFTEINSYFQVVLCDLLAPKWYLSMFLVLNTESQVIYPILFILQTTEFGENFQKVNPHLAAIVVCW
jgi:hypothetical protein